MAKWILVLLSFESFVATCMPHRLLVYQSGPVPPLIYALGSATLVGRNALLLWKLELLQPTEHHSGYLCDSADKTFKRIFTILDLFQSAGLPFLLLLVFNGSILYCLLRSRHRMAVHRDRRVGQRAAVADTNTHFGITAYRANGGLRRSPIYSPMPEVPFVQLGENEALENLGVFLTCVWNHTSLELALVSKAVQNLKATKKKEALSPDPKGNTPTPAPTTMSHLEVSIVEEERSEFPKDMVSLQVD